MEGDCAVEVEGAVGEVTFVVAVTLVSGPVCVVAAVDLVSGTVISIVVDEEAD